MSSQNHIPKPEGYILPKDYLAQSADRIKRLIALSDEKWHNKHYAVPKGYFEENKARLNTIAQTPKSTTLITMVPKWLYGVAAVAVILLAVTFVIPSDNQNQLQLTDEMIYSYLESNPDLIQIEDLVQLQFIGEDEISQLRITDESEAIQYLEDHLQDISEEELEAYLDI